MDLSAAPPLNGNAAAVPREPLDALTSLRFFAAFAVLLYHSGSHVIVASGWFPLPLVNFIRNGYLGVSFFFVLSGFILTWVYYGGIEGKGALKRFWLARFARVYPVYLLAIFIIFPLIPQPVSPDSVAQFFLLQMWLPLNAGDFQNWNGPAWTLSVELLFYLVFPALLSILSVLSRAALFAVTLGICLLMIAGRLPGISEMERLPFEVLGYAPVPLLRLPEFIYGICLALLRLRGDYPRELPWAPHAGIALCLAVLSASQSLWITPFAAISFGLLIFSAAAWLRPGLLASFLTCRVMVLLGGASYSLYLLQTPVREWLRVLLTGPYEMIGRMIYQPLLVLISIAVFVWFEEPARALLKRLGGNNLRAAASGAETEIARR